MSWCYRAQQRAETGRRKGKCKKEVLTASVSPFQRLTWENMWKETKFVKHWWELRVQVSTFTCWCVSRACCALMAHANVKWCPKPDIQSSGCSNHLHAAQLSTLDANSTSTPSLPQVFYNKFWPFVIKTNSTQLLFLFVPAQNLMVKQRNYLIRFPKNLYLYEKKPRLPIDIFLLVCLLPLCCFHCGCHLCQPSKNNKVFKTTGRCSNFKKSIIWNP